MHQKKETSFVKEAFVKCICIFFFSLLALPALGLDSSISTGRRWASIDSTPYQANEFHTSVLYPLEGVPIALGPGFSFLQFFSSPTDYLKSGKSQVQSGSGYDLSLEVKSWIPQKFWSLRRLFPYLKFSQTFVSVLEFKGKESPEQKFRSNGTGSGFNLSLGLSGFLSEQVTLLGEFSVAANSLSDNLKLFKDGKLFSQQKRRTNYNSQSLLIGLSFRI